MMELYRERGVNPFGGCLPLLLQMPVFITLYRMLWSAFELRRAPFLWMVDLSEPDRLFKLPFSIPIPFSGGNLDAVNLLPILGAVAMLLSTEFMNPSATAMQNPQQKMMMRFMPVIFSVFMYNLASGLNLYILISTILGIAQSQIIQRMDIKVDTTKKKTTTAHRPQHFYAAAQARKRDAARETRREKEQRRSGRGPRND
jgi:YidC/Oxa1 family membrane protein insertase